MRVTVDRAERTTAPRPSRTPERRRSVTQNPFVHLAILAGTVGLTAYLAGFGTHTLDTGNLTFNPLDWVPTVLSR